MAARSQIILRAALIACTGAALAACTERPEPAATRTAMITSGDSILPGESILPGDSILSMDTMIARFQAEHPAVESLGANAPQSLDELIERFAAALEDDSGRELDALTLTAAEFAYLYFPTSIYARPPYAQPPAVNWLLYEQNSLKGRARLLRAFGGTAAQIEGHDCENEPVVEGRNRIYERCTLRLRGGDGQVVDARLFGAILERDGRFRIMSLANRL